MEGRLAIYPETTGRFVIASNGDVMTGFKDFSEAHSHAIDILSDKEEFIIDRTLIDVAINMRGTRAVLTRIGDRIEERRYTTEKDGTVNIEREEHLVKG